MKILDIRMIALMIILKITVADADSHHCDRSCEFPEAPRVCEYKFIAEWYYTMSKACYDCPFIESDCTRPHCVPADGVARPVITVNRTFPGPAIRVCHNDIVRVEIENDLDDNEGLTIHWHGLYMRDSPHMDGVPMLTQCSIEAKTSFTYEFTANPPGTHWWHSHTAFQRSDGLAGQLIVKRAQQVDPHWDLYDIDSEDYVIFVFDWLHQLTLTKFLAHHHSSGNNKGENILINGKGVFKEFFNAPDNSTIFTPREVFKVEKNKRYRFRTISNAVLFCPYELTIDGHMLNIIASDGADIKPYLVSSLVVHGGERFDFVVEASQNISNYWMRIQGLADCRNQSQKAIVRYLGAPTEDPLSSPDMTSGNKLQLNPWNIPENENYTQVSSLRPEYSDAYPANERYKGTPDQTQFIGFDFYKINNPNFNDPNLYPIEDIPRNKHLYTPQLNNVSFAFPKYPVLTQFDLVDTAGFCDPESKSWSQSSSRFCANDYCYCTYVIDIAYGNLVELVIYDEGRTFDAGHPMHMHGQHFAVVAMEKLGKFISTEEIKEMHANGSIEYDFDAILKDTVIIPDGGYTVVRFLADNPGVWIFHCHLAFHSEIGMELVFKVGEPDQWIKPPSDFPKCGAWKENSNSSGIMVISSTPFLVVIHIFMTFSAYIF